MAEIEQELHELQLQMGELRVRLETLVQRTMEELQLDLPAQYAQLADGGRVSAGRDGLGCGGGGDQGAAGQDSAAGERESRCDRRAGWSWSSASTFLATQVNDLTESKQQLEELIDEINMESGMRFEQTFNAVREHFQGMFRKLFGGGKADIYLETEIDDVIDRADASGPMASGFCRR